MSKSALSDSFENICCGSTIIRPFNYFIKKDGPRNERLKRKYSQVLTQKKDNNIYHKTTTGVKRHALSAFSWWAGVCGWQRIGKCIINNSVQIRSHSIKLLSNEAGMSTVHMQCCSRRHFNAVL